MTDKAKFPYDIPEGAVMDYVNGCFLLVVKDDIWNQEEIDLLKTEPFTVHVCATNGILPFILEGGPVDSSDLYFNIQECDAREEILSKTDPYEMEIMLVDENNDICYDTRKTLSLSQSSLLRSELEKQAAMEFMPGEYDTNVEGLMSAYEPFELLKYARCAIKF